MAVGDGVTLRVRRQACERALLDEHFLAALAEGMPPSAGNALGFDRLVALALGAPSVGAVMAFPDTTL
jgi:elongation factor P--(R)-beta-lysine ligase